MKWVAPKKPVAWHMIQIIDHGGWNDFPHTTVGLPDIANRSCILSAGF